MYHMLRMNYFINKSNTKMQGMALAVVFLFSVGQSLAYYKSCEMNMSDHKNHTSQVSGHDSMFDNTSQISESEDTVTMDHNSDIDCCDSSCICPQGACSSVNLISYTSSKLLAYNQTHSELNSQNSLISDNFPNSLYRPPIAC